MTAVRFRITTDTRYHRVQRTGKGRPIAVAANAMMDGLPAIVACIAKTSTTRQEIRHTKATVIVGIMETHASADNFATAVKVTPVLPPAMAEA